MLDVLLVQEVTIVCYRGLSTVTLASGPCVGRVVAAAASVSTDLLVIASEAAYTGTLVMLGTGVPRFENCTLLLKNAVA